MSDAALAAVTAVLQFVGTGILQGLGTGIGVYLATRYAIKHLDKADERINELKQQLQEEIAKRK